MAAVTATAAVKKRKERRKVEGVYERIPGSGHWSARYRVDGKLVRKSFGSDWGAAVDWVEAARTVRRSGLGALPATAKRAVLTLEQLEAKGGNVTVSELCDDLLRHICSRPEQYKDQKNPPRLIEEVRKALGELPAEKLRPRQITDWLEAEKHRRGLRPATLNKMKATLSAMFREGILADKVSVNPARSVKQRKPGNGVVRFLLPEEEIQLRAVLQFDIDEAVGRPQYQKHMLHRVCELDIALHTGMRRSESYGLCWWQVDLKRAQITLSITKNTEPRIVWLNNDAIQALTRLKELGLERKDRVKGQKNSAPADSVFAIGDPKKWFNCALKRAGIKRFRYHDLRHTFASRLAQNGASLKVIQEAMGHKTIAMAARYAHLMPSNVQEAVAMLSRS